MDRVKLTTPPYKGSGGHFLTSQLFYERSMSMSADDKLYEPLFSLSGKDGYIDARKTYTALEDPTGYKWAMKYLGSWKHFEALMASAWFPPHVEEWNDEIRIKLRSEALQKIRAIAGSDSKSALVAAKYLANIDYESKRGRPSKAEVKGELKRQTDILRQADEDATRIGLTRPQATKEIN